MAFEDEIQAIAERIPGLRSQGNLDDDAIALQTDYPLEAELRSTT